MTEDTAKELAAAMNRLAAAIEGLRGGSYMPGIQVHHTGFPVSPNINPQWWPQTICGPAYSHGGQ